MAYHSTKSFEPVQNFSPINNVDPAQKTQNNPLRFKTITPSDIQTKKSLGFCFRCDVKCTPGHVCKNRMLNFMLVDDEVGGG